jgi:hypothetical protein
MSLLGGIQIYEGQLVEGSITALFQEVRKVMDRLATAAECVAYTQPVAASFQWQRWRGRRKDTTSLGLSLDQVRLNVFIIEAHGVESPERLGPHGMARESRQGNPSLPSLEGASVRREVRVFSKWEEIFPRALQGILSTD